MNKNRTTNIVLLIFVAAAFASGAFFYPQLPDKIASHWNASGEVDGYMNKFWGVFILPVIMLVLFVMYWVIPKIDPLKRNIELFRKYYNGFWIFLFVFLLYVFGLQTSWNLGLRFNFSTAIVPAVAMLWYAVGIIIGKAKRNWFIGIRTPWTLSSDVVWEKTHKLGSKLFKIAAFISLLGLFFKNGILVAAIVAPAVGVALITLVYSYIEYRKLRLNG